MHGRLFEGVVEIPGKTHISSEQTQVLIRLPHGLTEAREKQPGDKERYTYSI
jgi:hypothetical protein